MYLLKEYKDIVDKFKGEEKKLAQSLIEKYLRDYSIESIADVNTLKEVIYYEIIQSRLQCKMNDFADNKTIPIALVNIMHANSDAIIKLKNNLGLYADKEKKTEFDVLKQLKKRFKVWLGENQGSRTIVCPHCGKMVMLKIKTDVWETQRHPFFKDRILYNPHLFKIYKEGKVTKEDVAGILECSQDYIDWVISKIEHTRQPTVETKSTEPQISNLEKIEPSLIEPQVDDCSNLAAGEKSKMEVTDASDGSNTS